jgi:hypothetical protein
MLSTAIVAPGAAAQLLDENALVGRLAAQRPVVVVDGTEPMLGRLRAALPALARFLDTHCESAGAVGPYALCTLAPRPDA